jgi:DNA repair exonuclease SbcCD ATPase subunit
MLKSVVAEGFLSWDHLQFDITSGITLIDGWNEDDQTPEGSGKSAILNAICWNLFGKLPKDCKNDEVIKDGSSYCIVETHYSNGDVIHRSRKPNDLYIRKFSGEIIKGKDAKETQELIEEYIGRNFETFCQSTYFAQNYDKKFLTSNQEDKGKILSSIQNLSVFDKARKESMELIKVENDKHSTLKNQIIVEESNLNNLKSQKDTIKYYIDEKVKKHKLQLDSLLSQKKSIQQSLNATQKSMSEVQSLFESINLQLLDNDELQLKSVRQEIQSQLSNIQYSKSQIDSLAKSYRSKELEGKNLSSRYINLQSKKQQFDVLETNQAYLKLLNQKESLLNFENTSSFKRLKSKSQELENYISNPTSICPSCGSELKNIDTSHIQKELFSVNSELDMFKRESSEQLDLINKSILNFEIQFKQEQKDLESESTEILSQLQFISEYLDKNKPPKEDDLKLKEKELINTISEIDNAIFKVQATRLEKSSLGNKLVSLDETLSNQKQREIQCQSDINLLGDPDIAIDYQKLVILDSQSKEIENKIGQLKVLFLGCSEHLLKLEQLKDGFKEIKSYVFVNALKELNYKTNQYLSELFEVQASIKFTSEDQKIETSIILDGRETGLGLLSGGQNRRFNLAVDLALSDIISNRKSSKVLDILCLDEYFKDLSEMSMEKCLDLLKLRKTPVLLIEHNTLFKNIVDNVFFVRLEDGTSEVRNDG